MRRLVCAGLVLAVLPSGPAVAREPDPPEPEAVHTITGRGFGHGRGMSQFGAQGAALAGRSVQQILDFYYPGTTTGEATGTVRIRLTRDTTDGVRVVAATGLKLRDLRANQVHQLPTAPTRSQWSIDPHGQHGTRVRSFDAKTRKWALWRTLPGMAQFEGPAVIALVMPSGAQARYRGVLRSIDAAGAHLDTVNALPMESYLRGVVPREAIVSWRPAALQAQAVAARTYAAYHRKRSGKRAYDLCDTIACQVYGGHGSEKPATNKAIAATAGQVRLYRNSPIIAEFSSSNGGATAAGPVPYQVAKLDGWDAYPGNKNPNASWTVTRTSAQLRAAFGVGALSSVRVTSRTGFGPAGGRVLRVVAVGAAGTRTLTGDQVRSKLKLKSAWFTFAGVRPLDMPTAPPE
ncbi:SpoIID/LytB domain protein [Kribbella flavida DSM 17836]|uniref:SpoIID/LytB domain protein n=1 Tax=Kribbella flavida (strain DSM 17836 / JCM 10339 / NBRC 14399) TaxID=479435 RepID=D2PKI8_KRIFD|nr:SpoIID/LytB domain-containing protein [Kribbella flavida]ADB30500.1 SpoIID/LytB domain protein [Kribbella flavida DSM 17836]